MTVPVSRSNAPGEAVFSDHESGEQPSRDRTNGPSSSSLSPVPPGAPNWTEVEE
jgi:hypothetical protein